MSWYLNKSGTLCQTLEHEFGVSLTLYSEGGLTFMSVPYGFDFDGWIEITKEIADIMRGV